MEDVIQHLQSIVGPKNVSNKQQDIIRHSHDASFHPQSFPEVVVWPETSAHVQHIAAFAHKKKIPLTVFGMGTSLEGNPIPLKKGIVMNMMRMNKIVQVLTQDFQVIVEPGVIGDVLNRELSAYNLFFPAFPASSHMATIGGMLANNAGGMYAVKYGVVGDWVMSLDVVLSNGTLIKVGSRSLKSVAGYDLKRLFIGSEGTLGIITQAILKLLPVPAQKTLMHASFARIEDASKATLAILQKGLDPAAVEFLDASAVGYVNATKSLGWTQKATIIIELHGEEEANHQKEKQIRQLCKEYKSESFYSTIDADEIKRIWEGRKAVHRAIVSSMPGAGIIPGDIGVPISHIPEFVERAIRESKKYDVYVVIFGHIGDGNFHVWIVYTIKDPASLARAKKVGKQLVSIALSLGGTCTGEHGVGIGKIEHLQKEHHTSIAIMKQVKKLFDPHNILNPGKMFKE